ncbi:MAG TPA: WXG100 family type VII secretion target, partial [Pseudonocardiaceae bacterium]|nr:WXG100 family type VII secretion target [Pseudonocardiaceae bacterium]
VLSTAGNVGGIITQAVSVVMDLEKMIVPPTSFATIGGAVASANTVMQGHQVTALQSLLKLLQDVTGLVKKVAAEYNAADQAVSQGYGGQGLTPGTTAASGLWSSTAGAQLANTAISASLGGPGQPQSVTNVVGYLNQVGLGQQGAATVPTGSTAQFTSWLDASPNNQAQLGVIGVYSGVARGFGDVPGGVVNGDMVIIDPGSASGVVGASDPGMMLGIIGNSNQLYNNGLLQPNFGGLATLRVYRPMTMSV